jgi:predicted  nucleic acid-binding Zn-ribbon protein
MKREDLKAMGLTDELIDKVMAENGKDIEAHKAKLSTVQTELDGLKKQLTDANTAIEGFKGMNIDQIKASADEWKTKAEKAQADAAAEMSALKFDHALDGALTGAKAKNAKAVRALLDLDKLKMQDGAFSEPALKEQLDALKKDNDFLFESDEPTPKLVTGGNSQPIGDAVINAARKAAGLPVAGA